MISRQFAHLYGSGDLDAVFPDEMLRRPAIWDRGGRRIKIKDYDQNLVDDILRRPPHESRRLVDPRDLHATQSELTRSGVKYYLGDTYWRTGRTFADQHNPGNIMPVVYFREDGQNLILSGHHRAAAKFLRGEPLEVRGVHGPWGPPRSG